jgi:hypothetical protein
MKLNNKEVEKDQLTKYQLLIQLKTLYKITDKLEQRIATLEKVLQSHAKVIGEIRDKDDLEDMPEEVLVKTWTTKNTSGDETIWVGKK